MSHSIKQPPKRRTTKKPGPTPEQRKFQLLLKQAGDKVGLGTIYVNDGALSDGVRLYREAADLLQKAHDIRAAALKG